MKSNTGKVCPKCRLGILYMMTEDYVFPEDAKAGTQYPLGACIACDTCDYVEKLDIRAEKL